MARAMKDSGVDWLGAIPESYNVRRIKHIGSYHNGLTYTPNDLVDDEKGTLVLRSSNIQQGRLCFDDNVYVSAEIPDDLLVKRGDIIICSRNGSRELVGKCAIIENDMRASFGAFMMIFRCDFPKYMYYVLNSGVFKYYLNTFLTSTINQLTGSNFGNMKVVVPPLAEQKRIADFLDGECARIDSVVAKTRATIEEYRKLKQSLITRAVTKGIRPNRPTKDSGIEWIGDIPADWETIKLKYLFSIIGGNGFPDVLQGNEDGDYPFCKVSDINGAADYVNTASNWVSQSVVENNQFNVIPIGSIIMAKIGAALRKNHRKINTVKCCIDNNTQALVPRRNDDRRYLLYLSKCIDMGWFDNNSTVPSVNNPKLLNFFVPNVSKSEQKEIAAYLDEKTAAIDSLIAKKNRLVTELESLKKSLIFEYVTGKKEVPT